MSGFAHDKTNALEFQTEKPVLMIFNLSCPGGAKGQAFEQTVVWADCFMQRLKASGEVVRSLCWE